MKKQALRNQLIRLGRNCFGAVMLIALVLGSVARANEQMCLRLFHPAPGDREAGATLDLSGLNGPSREFVVRLSYLIRERRLIGSEILTKIISTPTPFNPLVSQARELNLLPHFFAFSELLKQELDWEGIRNASQTLARLTSLEHTREATAAEKTADVLIPIELRRFPFSINTMIRTNDGRALAVTATRDPKTTTVSAYDLATGTLVSSTNQAGSGSIAELTVTATRQTALAAVPSWESRQVWSFDLLSGQATSHPLSAAQGVSDPRFIEIDGKLKLVALQRGKTLLLDLDSSTPGLTVEFSQSPWFMKSRYGTIGEFVYVASYMKETYFIDPTGKKPIFTNENFMAIDAFEFQGQTLGLGISVVARPDSDRNFLLKTFDILTGKEFAPIIIPKTSQPRLIDRFEREGHLYGLLVTDSEFLTVDLLTGEIQKKLSETQLVKGLKPQWEKLIPGHAGFDYKGARLIPMILTSGSFKPERLVLINAMTFEPVGKGLLLDEDILNVEVVPGNGKDFWAILRTREGTSRLISLVNRI